MSMVDGNSTLFNYNEECLFFSANKSSKRAKLYLEQNLVRPHELMIDATISNYIFLQTHFMNVPIYRKNSNEQQKKIKTECKLNESDCQKLPIRNNINEVHILADVGRLVRELRENNADDEKICE